MKDVYDDGSVIILHDDDIWIGEKGKPSPVLLLFEVEPGTYLIERDDTFGEAFRQLEAMSTIEESFYFDNSADFYKLDEMAFLMLRMVL